MKRINISVLAFLLMAGSFCNAQPFYNWAKRIGGGSVDRGNSVTVDASGNVYTIGVFVGVVDFDPGPGVQNLISAGASDIYVTKMDATGRLVWAKRMGGGSGDYGNAIAVDASGNVYTTGYFVGTADFDPGPGVYNITATGFFSAFIASLDASGNLVWAKSFSSNSGIQSSAISVDVSGNVYTTGLMNGTVDFDPGSGVYNLTSAGAGDIFVSKLDAMGNFTWAKSFGGTGSESATAIAIDASGNVYTTGYFQGPVDFDPGTGTQTLTSVDDRDIFISRLDALGNYVWAKSMGGSDYDVGYSIAVDASGNVYTTGFYQGTADFDPGPGIQNLYSLGLTDIFVSKLDAAGNFVWAKSMVGTNFNDGYSIAVDASGNVYITGAFYGTVDFDPGTGIQNLVSAGSYDIFIAKLNAAGNFVWAKQMGGGESDYGESIAVDASGNVYITGYFKETVDFDPGTSTQNLVSAGDFDMFIVKFSPTANLTIVADAQSKVYGSADPPLTWQVSGFAYGENVSVITGSLDRTPGENAGTYTIGLGTLSAPPGYIITYGSRDLTITPAALAITAHAQSKVYGTSDPAFTYTATGYANGDNNSIFTGSLNRIAGENVGAYSINQNTLSAGSNYTIAYTGNDLTITPGALAITANAQTKVYGTPDPALTYTATGFANGDNSTIITGGLNRAAGENAGVYSINQNTLTAGSNYTITYTGNNLTISPAALTITANAQTKVYGTADPAFTYTAAGFANGDNSTIITGGLNRMAGENAGVYAINQNTLSAGNNYAISYNGNNLTITKAPQIITWVQNLAAGCDGLTTLQLTAIANSGLPVSYTVANTGIATVSADILKLVQFGETAVTARQEGDANYLPATPVTQILNYQLASGVRQHFNDLLLFDNRSGEYVQWQWYKNGTPVTGATTAWYSETAPLNGTYYVLVTDKNGARLQTCPITCTGSGSVAGGIKVYPNPVAQGATTTVTCSYSEAVLQGARLLISDQTGAIRQQLTNVQPSNQVSLPHSSGVYIITLLLSNGQKATVNALVY